MTTTDGTAPTAGLMGEDAVTSTTPPHAPPAVEPVPEPAIDAAFGFGWSDMLATVIERTNSTDSQDIPVDWSRLQLARNVLCIGVATCVPIDGQSAALRVADACSTYGLSAPLVHAGMALGIGGAALIGRKAPGPGGAICRGIWALLCGAGRLILRFVRSRLGWIVVRPVIWAVVCGLVILTWRFVVHVIAGA